jgi:hypothetical protein
MSHADDAIGDMEWKLQQMFVRPGMTRTLEETAMHVRQSGHDVLLLAVDDERASRDGRRSARGATMRVLRTTSV